MEQKLKSEEKKLKVLFFIRYFGDAFFYSFFQIFLTFKGLSTSEVGIVAAITPLTSIAVNPFWQFFSKDANTNRKIIRILTIIEAILIILFTQVNGFELLAILTALLAIIASPFYSLLDGFTATFCDIQNEKYSKIRIYGSLAYVFATTIGGYLIGLIGYSWVFLICAIFFMLTSLLITWVKPLRLDLVKEDNKPLKRDYKALLTNVKFYLYIVFYVMTVTISNLGDTFFGVFLTKERGLTEMQYGMYYSYIVICECLIMFILGKYASKAKDVYIFLLMGIAFFIRLFIAGLDANTLSIIICAGSRGIAYGSMLYINYKYIIKIVKVENVTAAILILAIIHNISLAIFNVFGGQLIEKYGYNQIFFILSMIILLATITYFAYNIFFIKEKKDYDLTD